MVINNCVVRKCIYLCFRAPSEKRVIEAVPDGQDPKRQEWFTKYFSFWAHLFHIFLKLLTGQHTLNAQRIYKVSKRIHPDLCFCAKGDLMLVLYCRIRYVVVYCIAWCDLPRNVNTHCGGTDHNNFDQSGSGIFCFYIRFYWQELSLPICPTYFTQAHKDLENWCLC